ncbi:MAG: hypothetical protein ACK4TL_04670 [Hyphomicrobiaceae bacterium]
MANGLDGGFYDVLGRNVVANADGVKRGASARWKTNYAGTAKHVPFQDLPDRLS